MTENAKQAASRLSAGIREQGFKPVGLHTYTDELGEPRYWRIRAKHPETGEKWIRPMHSNGHGFELGEPKFEGGKLLYALHTIASDNKGTVWVVEGEQKADALNKLGLLATTSGGATSADKADWEPLRGRTVRLWPDNDDPGKAYAGEVAQILIELDANVSCVDVNKLSLSSSQDVIDWLAAHPDADAESIEGLPVIASAENVARPHAESSFGATTAATPQFVAVDLYDFIAKELPTREAILAPWMLTQSLSMLYAWRGVGKTHVALGIAYAVAAGGKFLNWEAPTPRSVLYIDGEMPAPALQERLINISIASEIEVLRGKLRLLTPDLQPSCMPDLATIEGQAAIDAMLGDAELIIVDNLSSLVRRGGRENDAESWLSVSEWALRMRSHGRSVLFIHHSGKNGQQRGTSKREDLLDTVISLKQPPDYEPAQGAVFEVHYEKSRNLHGDETDPIEARLTADAHNRQVWVTRAVTETTINRVVSLANEGLTQSQIADELEVNRSTVSRAWRKGEAQGLIKAKAARAPNRRAEIDD